MEPAKNNKRFDFHNYNAQITAGTCEDRRGRRSLQNPFVGADIIRPQAIHDAPAKKGDSQMGIALAFLLEKLGGSGEKRLPFVR